MLSENTMVRRESPLAECNRVQLSELPLCGYLNLRGDPDNPVFLDAVRTVLTTSLPLRANTFTHNAQMTVLWQGPDEWLIITTSESDIDSLHNALHEALGDMFAAITDVSSSFATMTLQGSQARDVLARGCTLDLHPRIFRPGDCARTRLAKISATLLQLDDVPTFQIIVPRSFAEYFWQWLQNVHYCVAV